MSMRIAVANDLSDSAFDFLRLVWPMISPWCGGGECEPVESTVEKQLANDLDFYAGIDAYHKVKIKGVMRGIASRIQWGDKAWDTFTIRKSRGTGASTELNKRIYALSHRDDGYLYPHFTVQAYISKRRTGHLLSVAMCHTRQLIPYAYEKWKSCGNCPEVIERKVYEDGKYNTFLAVDWMQYQRFGFFIKRWPETTTLDTALWTPKVLKEVFVCP